MTNYTDNLWRDLVHDQGPALATATSSQTGRRRRRRLRRPKAVAGGTLGLAGLATAAALVFGGTAATSPAFAISTQSNGTVQVQLDEPGAAAAAASSLGERTGENIEISVASGPASASGAVTCTAGAGVTGPTVQVLLGQDGTGPIPTSSGSAVGHLTGCTTFPYANSGGTGNSGEG